MTKQNDSIQILKDEMSNVIGEKKQGIFCFYDECNFFLLFSLYICIFYDKTDKIYTILYQSLYHKN